MHRFRALRPLVNTSASRFAGTYNANGVLPLIRLHDNVDPDLIERECRESRTMLGSFYLARAVDALVSGDRGGALKFLRQSVDAGKAPDPNRWVMARSLLTKLEADDGWPRWTYPLEKND